MHVTLQLFFSIVVQRGYNILNIHVLFCITDLNLVLICFNVWFNLGKYDVLMYGLTTLIGFYCTLDLCQSKLFYLPMFNLQLKRSESERVSNFRFINVVILENIPQLAIQIAYLFQNSNAGSSVSSLVFISMTFSILSIIMSFLLQISRICHLLSRNNKLEGLFTHKIEICGILSIQSSKLKRRHVFAHSQLEQSMYDVLNTCEHANQWHQRSDTRYTIEIYYIKNYIKTLRKIDATFIINVFTFADYKRISQTFKHTIEEMGDQSMVNHTKIRSTIQSNLRIGGRGTKSPRSKQLPMVEIKDLSMSTKCFEVVDHRGRTTTNAVIISETSVS